ncbi:MAG: colanic acid biosynthesis acetyltransferase WcaF [Bradyrhizobium sp.]|uniref:WcaF family extracellular polysaccharide biosynthesis acetyltransferase n=1 Tax=Bradyrhizobium sp. TaxID=376 RepID=UPI001A2CB18E|nr:WcaF family extracellular polysaccharide biosynthesis acetyltransferase [Bradyrhizobium sp.]MBJ7401773.1 colanic acid biosynthesis acetyltransferase WcaF [Bradyrhizobium sp.]
MRANRFQDLSRFAGTARGREAWRAQLWWLFQSLLVLPTPQFMFAWRRFALVLFGAKIGKRVLIRPGVRVTYPWNVTIGDHVWIGDNATLYSVAEISIGSHTVISQDAYLCAGTHDHRDITFPFKASPIRIADECWVAARAFIGPGVKMGQGAIAGAGSIVMGSVAPATVVAGNPAKVVRPRPRQSDENDTTEI